METNPHPPEEETENLDDPYKDHPLEAKREEILHLLKPQNLVETALQACKNCLKGILKDDPDGLGGFSFDEIGFKLRKQAFYFQHPIVSDTITIVTYIDIYETAEHVPELGDIADLGTYRWVTYPDGKFYDEFLDFTGTRLEQVDLTWGMEDLMQLVPDEHLNPGSKYFEFVSCIALTFMLYQGKDYKRLPQQLLKAFRLMRPLENNQHIKDFVKKSRRICKYMALEIDDRELIPGDLRTIFFDLHILKESRRDIHTQPK